MIDIFAIINYIFMNKNKILKLRNCGNKKNIHVYFYFYTFKLKNKIFIFHFININLLFFYYYLILKRYLLSLNKNYFNFLKDNINFAKKEFYEKRFIKQN